ncbi:hypothetical protein [Shewanella scandinavica]|uniref:hypothetical protein n=1 Tax=Shewanella scandinavica TaxID=3063538 RepID=UPI00319A415B
MISETKKSYFEWVSKHWIVITALATLITSILGGISSTIYYSAFHVNYTELAELNDFIKHAISRPFFGLVLLTAFFTISAQTYLLYKFDKAHYELKQFYLKQRCINKVRFKVRYHLIDIFLTLLKSSPIWLIAIPTTNTITKLELDSLKSTESNLYNIESDTGSLKCVSYIGRININHVFWKRTNKVIIIPSSSIKSMTFVTSLAKRPKEFVADNQVRTNKYLSWEKYIKEACGKEFDKQALM